MVVVVGAEAAGGWRWGEEGWGSGEAGRRGRESRAAWKARKKQRSKPLRYAKISYFS